MGGQPMVALIGGIGCLVLSYIVGWSGRSPGMSPLWGPDDEARWAVLRWMRLGCMFGLALVIGLTGVALLLALAFGRME